MIGFWRMQSYCAWTAMTVQLLLPRGLPEPSDQPMQLLRRCKALHVRGLHRWLHIPSWCSLGGIARVSLPCMCEHSPSPHVARPLAAVAGTDPLDEMHDQAIQGSCTGDIALAILLCCPMRCTAGH